MYMQYIHAVFTHMQYITSGGNWVKYTCITSGDNRVKYTCITSGGNRVKYTFITSGGNWIKYMCIYIHVYSPMLIMRLCLAIVEPLNAQLGKVTVSISINDTICPITEDV